MGLPGDTDAAGEQVLYSGGRLGPDLTLPRLRQRWTDTPGNASTGSGGERVTALQATAREAPAARLWLHRLGRVGPHDGARGAEEGLLAATGDALVAAALAVEGPLRGPLTRAAAHYERAGRLPQPSTTTSRVAGHALSRAARDLARAGTSRHAGDGQAALELVRSLLRLTDTVARLHAQRNRPLAEQAATLSASILRDWQHHVTPNIVNTPAAEVARLTVPPRHDTPHAERTRRGRTA